MIIKSPKSMSENDAVFTSKYGSYNDIQDGYNVNTIYLTLY